MFTLSPRYFEYTKDIGDEYEIHPDTYRIFKYIRYLLNF